MLKLYERYQTGTPDDLPRRDSVASDRKTVLDEQQKSERRRFLHEQYRNQLEDMLEINQTLSEQIFSKVAAIPYAIRQFCKCLF